MTRNLKRFLKILLYFALGFVLLKAAFIAYLVWFQPPLYFPKPTGSHAVGVKTYHWIDTSRLEILHHDPLHPHRELMVSIWYPAQGTLAEKPATPYAPELVSYLKKNHKKMWFLGFARPLYAYAQPEALINTGSTRYPVILFSHGSGVVRESNTAQCEELASHGYIVVSMSHPYNSYVTMFPDKHIADGEQALKERYNNPVDAKKLLDQDVEIRFADAQFVLKKLELLAHDTQSMFYERIDQNNIGMFGHSLGGATTAQICRRDARVKAGINMDGTLYGTDPMKNIGKPLMFISHKESTSEKKMLQAQSADVYSAVIKNMKHMGFTDFALFNTTSFFFRCLVKMNEIGDPGPMNGYRSTKIVNAYVLNFFDKYLKNNPSELLDDNNKKYPEVEAQKWIQK
ncbi:MAG: Platelet-activating factor acetylhydrolase plasma/intracellular isoform II [candidate division TM6 bacterium GW2011_GWE2_41_16]|nr:MAG: Platelet-activating factor acetylhydrolase plasma/intracellular isoform II [candidate division TM6 bacterium GW2011_GWE2_41_16]